MGGEWGEVDLSTIADFVNGDRGKNYPSGDDFVSAGIPFISAANIDNGSVDYEGAKQISRTAFERLHSGKTQCGDVLFCLRGSLGKTGRIQRQEEAAIASSLVIVRAKKSTDPRFLYYVLQGPSVQGLMNALDNGSVQPNLSVREISKIAVPELGIPEQRAIAHILGTLDDKIELNRRMSETLEAMARALFKSWFVDFDPVRAKAEGRDPDLPKPIADLFPDSFEDSELGEIPKGWEVGSIGQDFALTMGLSPPGSSYNENGDGLPFFQGARDFGRRFPARRVYTTDPRRIAEPQDTLVSVRAPVGRPNIAMQRCCIGRGVAALRHNHGSRSFTFWTAKFLERRFERFNAEGTVFGSLNKKDFVAIRVIRPPKEVLLQFDELVGPWDDRVRAAHQESCSLASLRDTLLPKLISGELRIEDAERFLSEVE